MEAEQLAHASAELGPAGRADLRQQLLQPGRAAGTGERCRDLILLVHTQGMTQSKYKSQPLTCVSSAGRAAAGAGVRPYELAALSAATAPHSTSEELPLHIASRYPPIPRIEFAFWDA